MSIQVFALLLNRMTQSGEVWSVYDLFRLLIGSPKRARLGRVPPAERHQMPRKYLFKTLDTADLYGIISSRLLCTVQRYVFVVGTACSEAFKKAIKTSFDSKTFECGFCKKVLNAIPLASQEIGRKKRKLSHSATVSSSCRRISAKDSRQRETLSAC